MITLVPYIDAQGTQRPDWKNFKIGGKNKPICCWKCGTDNVPLEVLRIDHRYLPSSYFENFVFQSKLQYLDLKRPLPQQPQKATRAQGASSVVCLMGKWATMNFPSVSFS